MKLFFKEPQNEETKIRKADIKTQGIKRPKEDFNIGINSLTMSKPT